MALNNLNIDNKPVYFDIEYMCSIDDDRLLDYMNQNSNLDWFHMSDLIISCDAVKCFRYMEDNVPNFIPINVHDIIVAYDASQILGYLHLENRIQFPENNFYFIDLMCQHDSLNCIEYSIEHGIVQSIDVALVAVKYQKYHILQLLTGNYPFQYTGEFLSSLVENQAYNCMEAIFSKLSEDEQEVLYQMAKRENLDSFIDFIEANREI